MWRAALLATALAGCAAPRATRPTPSTTATRSAAADESPIVRAIALDVQKRGEQMRATLRPPQNPYLVKALLLSPAPELKASPRHAALVAQLQSQDVALAARLGARVSAVVQDGARVTTMPSGAWPQVAEVLDACAHVAKDVAGFHRADDAERFAAALQTYETTLDALEQRHPGALRFVGGTQSGTRDVLVELLACEVEVVALSAQLADTYLAEEPQPGPSERRCGSQAIELRQHQGPKGWSPWEVSVVEPPEKVACEALPTRTQVPADVTALLAKRVPGWNAGDLVTQRGDAAIDQDDGTVPPTPIRFVTVLRHSRKMPFDRRPCGAEGVACEGGGSRLMRAFNLLEFTAERAEAHRATGDAEKCRALVGYVAQTALALQREPGLDRPQKYRSKRGELLDGPTLKQRLGTLAADAQGKAHGHCDVAQGRASPSSGRR